MTDASSQPFFEPKDLAWLCAIPGFTAAAWTLPESAAERFCRILAWIGMHARPEETVAAATHMTRLLGHRAPAGFDAAAAVHALKVNYHTERLQIFRCHRPGGWAPKAVLKGREHVDAALAAGKGAVLYVLPTVWNHVPTKMAFHQAGFGVSHLSRPDHGFCKTRFGILALNRIQISVECRYLEERVVVADENGTAALRGLVRRLRQNRLISIIAGSQAIRPHSLPFFDGAIRLAGGPVVLALQTGATLLPVVTLRDPDGRSFTTMVKAPILPPATGGGDDVPMSMLSRYVQHMEELVMRAPDQFGGWQDTFVPEAAVSAPGDRAREAPPAGGRAVRTPS